MKTLTTTLLLTAAISANAGFVTGNKLMSYIESSNDIERALGLGFIAGVHDTGDGEKFCTPAAITLKQISDMVLETLRNVPSERHQDADLYVQATLIRQWPCAKKGNSL